MPLFKLFIPPVRTHLKRFAKSRFITQPTELCVEKIVDDPATWRWAFGGFLTFLSCIGWYRIRKSDEVENRVRYLEANKVTDKDVTAIMSAISEGTAASETRSALLRVDQTRMVTELHVKVEDLGKTLGVKLDTHISATNEELLRLTRDLARSGGG